jgi:hypothetical protein
LTAQPDKLAANSVMVNSIVLNFFICFPPLNKKALDSALVIQS